MSYKVEYKEYPYTHEVCVVGTEFMQYKDRIKGVKEWFEDDEIERSIGYDYIVKRETEGFSFYLGYGVDDLQKKYRWTVLYEPEDEELALQETIEILLDGLDMIGKNYAWERFPKKSRFYSFEYTGINNLNAWFDPFALKLEENDEIGFVMKIESKDSHIEQRFAKSRGWTDEVAEDEEDDMESESYPLAPEGFCFIYPSFGFEYEEDNNVICAWVDDKLLD